MKYQIYHLACINNVSYMHNVLSIKVIPRLVIAKLTKRNLNMGQFVTQHTLYDRGLMLKINKISHPAVIDLLQMLRRNHLS